MEPNSIKRYGKFSCLRIEMTINDPKEFKIYKDVQHREGKYLIRGFTNREIRRSFIRNGFDTARVLKNTNKY